MRPAGTEIWGQLGQKGDYELLLEANDRQRVLLAFSEGLFTASEYSTDGHVSSKHLEADFGKLGRIDIQLHLFPRHSQSYPPSKNCKGPASIYVPGTYRGIIEFSGDGDIPHVSVTHGEISFLHRSKRICKQEQPPAEKEKSKRKEQLDVGLLEVAGKGNGRQTIVEAISIASRQHPARAFGLLFAGIYERSEEVRIERSTLTFFGHESLRTSKPNVKPETVRLEPGEPFAGHALYSHSPGSRPTWTGDLSLDLPGAKDLPLVDPSFKTTFCRGSSLFAAERCAYGSGSHSQPLALARLSSLR